ncbi:hypothetical protein WR25_06405 [Diploscapter pachys]|uniref:SH3 domain-containing protein n=1 Tax=Diploscapter pachys TaxID=2018661 RepID=A0A2A2LYW6_9BILA|nr:hypothetical protein WR25_06405 [Diploscapter pachys]
MKNLDYNQTIFRTYDEVPDFVDRRKPVHSTNLPYNELVDLAESHRKQMNANRLSELEHETRALRQRNEERDKELKEGAERLEEERRIMQIAANRVKTLTQKWEEQRKRRQNAAAIALQEQRKMQLQSSCRSSEPSVTSSSTSSRSALNDVNRPRASVGPFQVQHNQQYEDHQYNIKDQADRPLKEGPGQRRREHQCPKLKLFRGCIWTLRNAEYQRKLPEPEKLDEQQPETSSEKTITDEESSMKSDEEPVEMDIPSTQKKVQGILKCRKGNDDKSDKENKDRHIRFDPLALLLDAALEGEIDLVKTSASQLGNVSIANDEGITALHNAICAGHYEIVRFLIEQNADVNAPDSDGWTPLHCAASCNNLPMVRQLVEGGACVLSSTLSDMETPVEKCEEEEEGYDGCLRYLTAAYHATGTINDGKVYTAYDYEAQYEDELDMNDGDEIKVLSKETEDQHWWFCERIKDGKKGLAPRTYLALYPALRFRKDLNFVMFDIISQSANSNLESNSPNSGQASVASSS